MRQAAPFEREPGSDGGICLNVNLLILVTVLFVYKRTCSQEINTKIFRDKGAYTVSLSFSVSLSSSPLPSFLLLPFLPPVKPMW